MRWRKIQFTFLEQLLSCLVVFNFFLFIIISVWLGGDAINGKVVNGHYLLGYKGSFTEVTRAAFVYSYVHAASTALSIVFAMWAGRRAVLRAEKPPISTEPL